MIRRLSNNFRKGSSFQGKESNDIPRKAATGGVVSKVRSMDMIYRRAGFLLRRAHQIADATFMDECAEFNMTPTQYGVLMATASHPGLKQIEVAKLLGIDRSTTAMVVDRLVQRGFIEREIDERDRRGRTLRLTSRGETLLDLVADSAARVQERFLKPFSASERSVFLRLLKKLLDGEKDIDPVPFDRAALEDREPRKLENVEDPSAV